MNDWMNGMHSKVGCHTGNPVVFEAMGVAVHGGGHSRNGGWHRMSPAPDLAMGPAQVMDRGKSTVVPDGFSCASHVGGGTHIISIDWPDFDIPQDIGREWWLALVDDIKRLGIKTVSTQCVGGHGRTGVQLAILAHLMGGTKQDDAAQLITWVRDNYCHHAVETSAQQAYVAECCDIPVGAPLFAAPKVAPRTLVFEDEAPKASYFNKQLNFDDDDVVEGMGGSKFMKGFEFIICNFCGTADWWKIGDALEPTCSCCGSDDVMFADDALHDCTQECPSCDAVTSDFAWRKGAHVCMTCEAKEQGIKTRPDGTIQCQVSKRYYEPETYINSPDFISPAAEHAQKAKKAKPKKGKGKGKVYKGKYGMNLDEWI